MPLEAPVPSRSNYWRSGWQVVPRLTSSLFFARSTTGKFTGYEVRVDADQAEHPPQVFCAERIHHVVTGFEIDAPMVEQAIRLSEEKDCSAGTMVQKTGTFHTTYEIVAEKTSG